jgi:Uncharacterized protein conserved in bacteria (DUF2188)
MSKDTDRTVYQNEDGSWSNKRNSASRPADKHPTQKAAIEAAKENLMNAGGGELTIKGRDGKIRSKDTIGGGNDPNPPKDKEH